MLQILEEVEGNKDLDDLVIESKLNTFEWLEMCMDKSNEDSFSKNFKDSNRRYTCKCCQWKVFPKNFQIKNIQHGNGNKWKPWSVCMGYIMFRVQQLFEERASEMHPRKEW